MSEFESGAHSDNVVKVDFRAHAAAQADISDSDLAKYERFKTLVEEHTVMVLIDARKSQVKAPPSLKDRCDLRLNFSYEFLISDFEFDKRGVRATLLFNEGYCFCDIPWSGVYGMMVGGEKVSLWPEDCPKEFARTNEITLHENLGDIDDSDKKTFRGASLRLISDESEDV